MTVTYIRPSQTRGRRSPGNPTKTQGLSWTSGVGGAGALPFLNLPGDADTVGQGSRQRSRAREG